MAYSNPYSYDEEAKAKEDAYKAPKLKTNRKMWKFMLLHILTFGIYGILFFIPFSFDLDRIAPKRDGTKTMNFLLVYILSLFTCSIAIQIWYYQIAKRVEEALDMRHIPYEFGTETFWTWQIFGSFILIGPFVFFHKLFKAMNLLCEDYNKNPVAK